MMSASAAATSVGALCHALRQHRGLAHKNDIAPVLGRLGLSAMGIFGTSEVRAGDDCAAIRHGDGWLLLAIEGLVAEFGAAEPWFAGYSSVMVNVSDVYAMGGRPIAVVDAIWSRDQARAQPVLDGMSVAASAYCVPVVGGHSNTRSNGEQLSVAILGQASRLLTSFDAQAGELLLAAIDLRGRYHDPNPYWDASSQRALAGDGGGLCKDLELLPQLAEAGLCRAAKDISMAGLVGTALMLAECSAVGMTIEPGLLPRPDGMELARWLASFPSYGFLLTSRPSDVPAIIAAFGARDIPCAVIGRCEAGTRLNLMQDGVSETFWDFGDTPLMRGAPNALSTAHA